MNKQQGVVIIVALFFVALVAAISVYMMGRLQRDTYRTKLILRNVNAEMLAKGSLLWAMSQLQSDIENQKPDKVVDKFPMKSAIDKVNGYRIYSEIYDAQAKFNLNNLINPAAQIDLKRLLHLLAPEMSAEKINEIVMATIDWITPGQQQNQFNKYYLGLSTPYRAAHQPMASISEWQWVKGMTPALYARMKNYVIVLPQATPVNVLTASGVVLAALHPVMPLTMGNEIAKICQQKQPPSIAAFQAIPIVKNQQPPFAKDKITTLSQFFWVETVVEIEDERTVIYTLLERKANPGKSAMTILSQSKGVPG